MRSTKGARPEGGYSRFSIWLAAGGVKGGTSYGITDDYSYNIIETPVHIRDLNATILHCLGMDHNRFTFSFQGFNQKPTGVEPATAVKGILACPPPSTVRPFRLFLGLGGEVNS